MYTRRPPTVPPVGERDTGALPVSSSQTENWKRHARSQMRYYAVFTTGPLAGIDGFYAQAEDFLEEAIQQAIIRIEKEQDCIMRLYKVEMERVDFYAENEQFVQIVGVVIVEPIAGGGVPLTGPKRRYTTR